MDFQQKLVTLTRHGCISFAVLAAKELGIFDTLCTSECPLTSQQLATRKNLKERYVREILGCLTSASLVQIMPASADAQGQQQQSSPGQQEGQLSYFLTPEAKAVVRHSATFVDIGLVGLIASNYLSVKACCYSDGPSGVGYTDDVFRFMDEMGDVKHEDLVNRIFASSPGLEAKLEKGITVIEFGSGTGRLLSLLATRFPNSTFTATDVDEAFTAQIRATWGHLLPNMRFMTLSLGHSTTTTTTTDPAGLSRSPLAKFDWLLAVNVLHHLAHPLAGLHNARQMMSDKEDALLTIVDQALPFAPSSSGGCLESALGGDLEAHEYATSLFFCVPESLLTEGSEAHGACWRADTVVALMTQAHFDVAAVHRVDDVSFHTIFVGRCVSRSG